MTIWLSSEILHREYRWEGGTPGDEEPVRKAYALWNHAEQALVGEPSRFVRVDAIVNLRRVIDQRVRLLGELYDLNRLPIANKPKGTLDTLALLGVVRPRMLEELIAVRNLVEHEDAEPPDVIQARVLSEFVWYFLRSTDRAVRLIVESLVTVDEPDEIGWIEVIRSEAWRIALRARVPEALIANTSRPEWLHLVNDKVEPAPMSGDRAGEVFVYGELRGPTAAVLRLATLFLESP